MTTAYKALNKDWTCRGFKYEVGRTYKHDGEVVICESGFHACENPFDCLSYYSLADSRFAEVELSGVQKRHEDDTKIAAAEITIKAELTLPEFIRRSVEWLIEATKGSPGASSGFGSTAASQGNHSKAASQGNYSKAASSGNDSTAASSGNDSTAASSGNYSKAASQGSHSKAASSGNHSKAASSGFGSTAASSGFGSTAASQGNHSKAASSGNDSTAVVDGENCAAAAVGINAKAQGSAGAWLAVTEYDETGKCVGFATGCIGQDGLNENTWYIAKGGKLLEEVK